ARTAPPTPHRRPLGFGASADPEQSVVQIGQAVEGDWSASKDPEADTDDTWIARGQRDAVQHDQAGVGEDFAEFVHALYPQSVDVAVPVRGVDRIKSRHHRGVEGVDAADAPIGISCELSQPAA